MKAFKIFDPNWTCKNFKYEVGKTYAHEGGIGLCVSGFHACEKAVDCFSYYSFDPENKVAEVSLTGDLIHGKDKSVGRKIKIIREVKWEELLTLVNTGKGNSGNSNSGNSNSGYRNSGNSNSGNRNSGYSNSGDSNSGESNSGHRNSGYRNSGYSNSGYRNSGNSNSGHWNSGESNSGDSNSGYWNSGHRNSGHFNTTTPDNINVFNKSCKRTDWNDALKPDFIYFDLCVWIWWNNMSDKEKGNNKDAFLADGYLKTLGYKEAWQKSFESADEEDIELLKTLPNFDTDVFEEITGIKIK